jgi:uncharacterized membrane protein YedE/YeeE
MGPLLFHGLFGHWSVVTITSSWPLTICAGFLVGFGTRMGTGCTSGHRVFGLARFSRRSIAAMVTCWQQALFSMGLVKPTAFVISMVVGIEIHDRLLRLKPDTARAN